MSYKIKSSGALMNNQTFSIFAHIELLNVDPDNSRNVTVLVLDWGAGAGGTSQTNPVATLLNFSGTIPPNTQTRLNAVVPAGHHYEVRITYKGDDFSVNTFGTRAAGAGWLEGYTVRNHEFFKIDLD
ncbi:hypothetical protein [Bacillus gaemokensis]|uniref:Uncharacterized protein n=1 Tax=Bacillus gaemokensis TaxID=574375 RepID=A0A073K508_9BACI|nr:hypothetical protein [Bacillus gaemokensis]KEK21631.1 hypothetical protein BAGA_27610 [Bacillus gaemokensis]KYG31010.1 hypothetical protein AZF08_27490 [Bacillus gaemokensis]